jgi:hypothetical protein
MPEGPAERGVEANASAPIRSARHAKSIDGAEPSGSIERVMAGRHAADWGAYSTAVAYSVAEAMLGRINTGWSLTPNLLASESNGTSDRAASVPGDSRIAIVLAIS